MDDTFSYKERVNWVAKKKKVRKNVEQISGQKLVWNYTSSFDNNKVKLLKRWNGGVCKDRNYMPIMLIPKAHTMELLTMSFDIELTI